MACDFDSTPLIRVSRCTSSMNRATVPSITHELTHLYRRYHRVTPPPPHRPGRVETAVALTPWMTRWLGGSRSRGPPRSRERGDARRAPGPSEGRPDGRGSGRRVLSPCDRAVGMSRGTKLELVWQQRRQFDMKKKSAMFEEEGWKRMPK